MKPRTAAQINDPQCGEAWSSYMVGGNKHAEQVIESLFKAMGVKLVTVKATKPKHKRAKMK